MPPWSHRDRQKLEHARSCAAITLQTRLDLSPAEQRSLRSKIRQFDHMLEQDQGVPELPMWWPKRKGS